MIYQFSGKKIRKSSTHCILSQFVRLDNYLFNWMVGKLYRKILLGKLYISSSERQAVQNAGFKEESWTPRNINFRMKTFEPKEKEITVISHNPTQMTNMLNK